MGHHKRCRFKRFDRDLGTWEILPCWTVPSVENAFLTMAFRRQRLVHDGLSPILCQLKGTTCYNMLHDMLRKHRGEVMLNPPRYNMGVQNTAK